MGKQMKYNPNGERRQRLLLRHGSYIICVLLALLLSGCALTSSGTVSRGQTGVHSAPTSTVTGKFTFNPNYSIAHPFEFAGVSFASGVTYAQALRLITDLGLQPVDWCVGAQWGGEWQSLSQRAVYNPNHGGLSVFSTPAAPSDWLARLAASPLVYGGYNEAPHCPLIPVGTPDPARGAFLTPSGDFTPVKVQFAVDVSYDQALDTLMTLGFRLGNPCSTPGSSSPANPVGQEIPFSVTHSLAIVTTFASSTLWRQQVTQAQGVLSVQEGTHAICP
ncbi:MAG TPA: hypothetical protein VIG77_10160 [Ktedonobacterales bacterium]|jgi:hypothetical protein